MQKATEEDKKVAMMMTKYNKIKFSAIALFHGVLKALT